MITRGDIFLLMISYQMSLNVEIQCRIGGLARRICPVHQAAAFLRVELLS